MGPSGIALRYAEALHAAARDAGRTAEVLADLALVKAGLDAMPEAWARILHPRTPAAEKEAFLLGGVLGGKDPLVANTFRLLVRRRRLEALRGLFRAYLEVHEREAGILRVEVETAAPLDAAAAEVLRRRLETETGRPVVLEVRHLPALLGGMRFIAGSRLIDGSLQSRLERIARGLHAIPVETA